MKVMIVDDEREIADLVEVYLKNDGYEVYKFYKRRAIKVILLIKFNIRLKIYGFMRRANVLLFFNNIYKLEGS